MLMGEVSGLLEPMITTAAGMSAAYIPIARTLLALAVTLAAAFAIYDWWLGDVSNALAKLVRAGVILSIPLTLFTGNVWSDLGKTTTQFFAGGLTQPLLGAAGHGGSGPDAIKDTIGKISKSMFPNARKEPDRRGVIESLVDWMKSDQTIGSAIFSNMTKAFFELVLSLVSIVLIVALTMALYGPLLAMQIGIIFGPLLLAFMPFPPLANLSKSWLAFMITTGFSLLVGVAMAVIAANSIESYTDMMGIIGNDASIPWYEELAVKIGGFMSSTAIILFVAWMLFRADDIAAAMVGGSAGGTSGVGGVIVNRISQATRGGVQSKPRADGGGKPPGGK